jgi:hypothetical protein
VACAADGAALQCIHLSLRSVPPPSILSEINLMETAAKHHNIKNIERRIGVKHFLLSAPQGDVSPDFRCLADPRVCARAHEPELHGPRLGAAKALSTLIFRAQSTQRRLMFCKTRYVSRYLLSQVDGLQR